MIEVKRTVTNEVEKTKRFLLTSIDDGSEVLLMSDLLEGNVLEQGKLYVEKIQEKKLKYIVLSPNGEKIDSTLDIKILNFNRKTLMESKLRILAETGKRGHTIRDQDINKFMREDNFCQTSGSLASK